MAEYDVVEDGFGDAKNLCECGVDIGALARDSPLLAMGVSRLYGRVELRECQFG